MSALGARDAQTAGRSGCPKSLQRSSSSSCGQGTPAGLPWGNPGRGELIDGAVQQAPHPGRQAISVGVDRRGMEGWSVTLGGVGGRGSGALG